MKLNQAELQSLIDRVADALGPEATPAAVEEVVRAISVSPQTNRSSETVNRQSIGDGPITGRIIVTAYGCDQPGILAAITSELRDLRVNVLDVSQKILQDYFTLILLADLSGSGSSPRDVQERLGAHGDRLGVRVLVQHEELFHAMHRP